MAKLEKLELEVETRGFEEATEKVEALVDAYDSFPAQVNIRGSKNCSFHIYPTQAKFVEGESSDEEERQPSDQWDIMVPPEKNRIIKNPNGAVIMSLETYIALRNAYDREAKKRKASK